VGSKVNTVIAGRRLFELREVETLEFGEVVRHYEPWTISESSSALVSLEDQVRYDVGGDKERLGRLEDTEGKPDCFLETWGLSTVSSMVPT
jgi:hypothetical protein